MNEHLSLWVIVGLAVLVGLGLVGIYASARRGRSLLTVLLVAVAATVTLYLAAARPMVAPGPFALEFVEGRPAIDAWQAQSPVHLVGQAPVRFVGRNWGMVLFLVLVGAAVAGVAAQVRRGAWTWPGVLKGLGIALLPCFLVVYFIRSASDELVVLPVDEALAPSSVSAARETTTPRIRIVERPAARSEGGTEPIAARAGDVEVWERESVLGFEPFSAREVPEWCREGLETVPSVERVGDTEFLSFVRRRPWLIGYSAQNPVVEEARIEALAAARRKLAVEALIGVKRGSPALDVVSLQPLAEHLAERYAFGRAQSSYLEHATLRRGGRPYGTVYRAAVRIDADPRTVRSFVRRIERNLEYSGPGGERGLLVAFLGGTSLVVLAFGAFLVYVFIRAGAAGQWALALRLVSSGMLAAIVFAVLYVCANLGAT